MRPISCVRPRACVCLCVFLFFLSMCFLDRSRAPLRHSNTRASCRGRCSDMKSHAAMHMGRERERQTTREGERERRSLSPHCQGQPTIAVKLAVAIDKAASVLDFVLPTTLPQPSPPPHSFHALTLLPPTPPTPLSLCLSVAPFLSFLSQAAPTDPLTKRPLLFQLTGISSHPRVSNLGQEEMLSSSV